MDYASWKTFRVIDEKTDACVLEGKIKLRQADDPLAGEDVYEMDIASLGPGTYHIHVSQLARSETFRVGGDGLRELYFHTMRAFFHQRCGQELREPWTWAKKPACHVDVWESGRFVDGPGAIHCLWKRVQPYEPKPGEPRKSFRGGYHDAADFDTFTYHLPATAQKLVAYEMSPSTFRDGDLNIPESGNGISVRLAEGHIAGRIAGSRGGTVRIIVPREVTSLGPDATLHVDGQPTKLEYDAKSHTFRFNVAISRQDGFETYSIQPRGRAANDDEAFPGLGDPHKWPFSVNSIWNMAIGTGAKYKPQPIASEHIDGIMVDLDIIIMTPDAPLMNVYGTDQLWGADVTPTRRCLEHDGIVHLRLPIPSEYITATGYGSRPNNPAAILLADGRTVLQTQPFQVCEGGHATTGLRRSGSDILRYKDVDLFGDGTYGMHGGSGLSGLGGAIRVGELAPGSGPIRHVLKISFPGKHYLYYDKENDIGYRWPARKHDSSARANYTGTEPEAKIGCLRAIPPTVDVNDLGLETEPGRKIAWTLQNYGAYQVEGVPWARCMIAAEDGPDGCVPELFQQQWGYEMVTRNNAGNPWFRDMIKIFNQLCIITNNRPNSIGGGGTPRVLLAPPLNGMGMQPGPYSLKDTTK